MDDESVIASGVFERIGMDGSNYTIKYNGEKIYEDIELENHTVAAKMLLSKLVDLEIIRSLYDIKGVGHRVLHGGERYHESVLINDDVIQSIKDLTPLGPLHHPGNLAGIEAFMAELPDIAIMPSVL